MEGRISRVGRLRACGLAALWVASTFAPALAGEAPAETASKPVAESASGIAQRSGLAIHLKFRKHLAEPDCANAEARWRAHFAHAPKQMATRDHDLLALFGYVVDELVEAGLPTEYALIPFVESGYKPAARSSLGPSGMWQLIALTARNQGVPMRAGYDGRFSVVDSTQAAVKYLKFLHGIFGGNWRLAVMAYNTGENRMLGLVRKSGQSVRGANPDRIAGVPGITRAYIEKIHALSCVLEDADDRKAWVNAIDRPIPLLAAEVVSNDAASLEVWARARRLDPSLLARINPALTRGALRGGRSAPRVLAPVRREADPPATADDAPAPVEAAQAPVEAAATPTHAAAHDLAPASTAKPGTHVVAKGDNAWTIARRYGLKPGELLRRNGLDSNAKLRPGMVLKLDAASP